MRTALPQSFGEGVWHSWLKHLQYVSLKDNILVLDAPTSFLCDWVNSHYLARLLYLAKQAIDPQIKRVDIQSRANASLGSSLGSSPNSFQGFSQGSTKGGSQGSARGSTSGSSQSSTKGFASPADTLKGGASFDTSDVSSLNPKYTFDNFVVGKPNELAFAAARRVAEADGTPPFNPLFLYGGVGLGKTHLMHAVAWEVTKRNPKANILYISAEKFMYQFIRSIRFRDTFAFKEKYRSVDLLMVDDVQFIANRDVTREEFFHTFNDLADKKRQIIISADKSPEDLCEMEERMRSRLSGGMVTDVHPATYELRMSILANKATDIGLTMPQAVSDFIARKITSNIRVLEGALHKIAAHSQMVDRPLKLEDAAFALKDLIRSHTKKVTIPIIKKRVAERFGISTHDLTSSRRHKQIVLPRQVAMYLAKCLTPASLPDIGKNFGNRDHTTVMHAVAKIENMKVSDPAFEEDVELLKQELAT